MGEDTTTSFVPGLQGVVAAETRLSKVDGQNGELVISGFPVEELAPRASFEEVVYLLWHDVLPGVRELKDFRKVLAAKSGLSGATLDLLVAAAKEDVPVMDALRMAAGTLDPAEPGDSPAGTGYDHDALTLLVRTPEIVASYWRMLNGEKIVEPDPELGYAENYLYMLSGEVPDAEHARALETYLNTVVDHGMNASTFAARVIISTRSDIISAVTGAIGALKGPLHGGAPGPALDVVFEIGEKEKAEPYLREKIEGGERLMGFGHRVYKVRDPRADVLAAAAERLYETAGDTDLYELALHVEKTAIALLEEYKPGRNLQTNVEFYTALLLHGVGLPTDLFTPTFAIGRTAGWTAHCIEQRELDRIIRPESRYVGPVGRSWVPPEER